MEASRLHTRLPAPKLRSPGVLGGYLFASLALHGLVFGNQGTVGLGQSDAFSLDTMDPNPMVNIGLADSSGFELDTGGDDGSLHIGTDESSGFILNTLDSPSSIDLNQAGFAGSGGFRLNTKDSTLGFVSTTDTGFADSSVFSLDTSGGNAVAWDLNDTGYADSSGFQLDTRDDSLFGDSSFSDSAGFQLDTRETNEVVDRSYADSGSFQLDTGGHDGSLLFGFSDSGSFQLDTRNRDEVYYGDANTSFADSSGFALDTRDGNGGSSSTGDELVSVKGTIFYDGVVSGSAYVWAMEANGSKAAEDKLSAGEGNYSILVEKGRAYDLKAFIDGNENGLASTGEPWGHYGEWNNTANRYNLLQVDGNLTHIHFNLEDRDTDSDGFLDWVEVEAGTDENNASSFPNTSPHFQSDGNLTILENQTFVFEFNASDPDVGTTLSYSILSGDDAGKFSLNTTTGGLTFTTAPDFESPDDNNTDNIYELTVQVSDGEDNATLDVNVTVLDVYEPSRENHTADLNSTVDLEMIWVEPGTFTMGQVGVTNAEPEHNVTLTQGFYLGKYEVTQAQYEAVMTGNTETNSTGHVISATPSQFGGNPDRPVEQVSWDDIQVFLTRLNEQQSENLPNGWAYVLPTEAQWEYACRAGTTTAYSWGDSISATDANWNHGNDANQTEDVGKYSANPWGFFDLHGNVREWTADAWGSYATGAQTDPFNVGTAGSYRVFRGGSWIFTGTFLRSAYRNSYNPSNRLNYIGFRVGFQIQPDEASPELELFGGADIPHRRDEPWAEPGYGASDVRDGNLSSSVSISGTVDVNTTGTYTLVYSVSDAAGNEANATRTVRVADESADADGDGFNDYLETVAGSDLNKATSTPFNYGLVAWYPFDGNASDMSGNGNDLTGTGYSFGEDRHGLNGKSCRLDQVYLSNTNFSESIDDNISFSWSLWVKMNSVPSAYPFILAVNDSTGNSESLRVNILHQKDQGKFVIDHLATGTNSSSLVKAFAKQTNQIDRWYQLTMVSSVSEVKLYVDSALQSTVPFQRDALKNEKPAIYVGGHLSWNLFDGSMDDIRIYDRALSAEEVGLLYRMEMPKLDLNDSNFMSAVNMWFSDEANATATYGNISDWNTSAVTNMSQAFKDRISFNEDISKWDVSRVKDFSGFFRGAKSFNQNIANWDTSSATTFAEMFRDATSFNQAIGDWNVSSLLSLDKIFWSAAAFNQDLSNWDIRGVNTVGHIFASADSLSEENKKLIHQTFSANSNWPYDWGIASNQAPQFQSDGNLSVEENQAFIYDFEALDTDGDVLTYSLNGGDDAAQFELIPSTGHLAFISLPAFKSPTDKDGDNRYEVILKVSDGQATASLNVVVEVTEKGKVSPNQAPQFQSDGNLSVEENQAFIYDFEALDVDGDVLTYSLNGGDDAAQFELIPSTGHLAFISLPAFKSPTDKDGDNRYEVTLQVSDGQATASLGVMVEVTEKVEVTPNQAPQFQSDGNLSVEENQAFIYEFDALDGDGDVLLYSLLFGDDKEFFKLNEATGGLSFIAPRDFEKPEDANADNVYELTIEVGDSFKNTALKLRVEVLDVVEDDKGDPSDSVGFAPMTIEGLEMFARDDGWTIYEETIAFDEHGRFHAVITNGYDNPVAGGEYSYTKTGKNTADLSYSVEGGLPFFQYSLTFTSDLSGTYTKEEDYGDSSGFASGPFSFKVKENDPNAGGEDNGGVGAPESLAGLEVDIHFSELLPNGDYEDLGMERINFGDFEVSAFDADSQQIEYEPYIYKKTSEISALITLGAAGHEMEEISLTFKEAGFAEGTWIEMDEGKKYEGTLTFRIVDENKDSDGAGPGDNGGEPGTGSVDFITPSFISVQEKDEFVTNIIASGGADLMYNLVTGADALFFQLNPVTGRLSFLIPRDFHHPEDSNLDNLYEVTIEASDGVNSGFLDLVVGIVEMKEDSTDPDKPTDPDYPGGPGMDELVFINPDFIEVEENMNYIAQIQASGLGGYSISYALKGGLDQKFFEIDPFTGDLSFFTPRDFDYPEDANQDNLYEVSIKASDGESSAVLDLVVGILDMPDDPKEPGFPGDVLLPIVYTNLGEISESGEIQLSGRVLHDGGGKIEEVGFFLSPRLRIDPMGPETVRLLVHTEHDFSWLLDESPFPKRLYIQAYAINEVGMNTGTIKRIKIPEPPMFWWGDVKEREGGWSESSWFGSFKYYDHGWLFHSSLQWLFSSPVDGDGVWLWKDGMNWLWTGENIWPYMWSHDRGDWIYVTGGQSGDGFIFYDYSNSTYRDF